MRAKTGTLLGVHALAGTVPTTDGRLLAFAFVADGSGSEAAAEGALDDVRGRRSPPAAASEPGPAACSTPPRTVRR